MYTKSDWVKAISKLTERTSKGKLTWTNTSKTTTDPDRRIGRCFTSYIGERSYIVGEMSVRNWIDDAEYYWEPEYFLEIWSNNPHQDDIVLAKAPQSSALTDLFRMVERQFAFKQDALKSLLEDEEEDEENL